MVSVGATTPQGGTSTGGTNPPQGGGSTRGTRPPQGGTQHRGGATGGHHTAGGTSTQGGPSHPPTVVEGAQEHAFCLREIMAHMGPDENMT